MYEKLKRTKIFSLGRLALYHCCIYGFSPPPNLGHNPGQKPDQKSNQKSGHSKASGRIAGKFLERIPFFLGGGHMMQCQPI